MSNRRDVVAPFNEDVSSNRGYRYTTNAPLSSRLANRRLTDVTLAIADLRGKRLLDIGCGDGAYTLELFERGNPAHAHGFDSAHEAIQVARQRTAIHKVTFAIHGGYEMPYRADSFDIAYIRGVLHHTENPVAILAEALRVAPLVVVIEPNGWNPGLKFLERFSRYHVEHGERSFAPRQLDQWIETAGAHVRARTWAGLVPFFCPDWMARALKAVEPLVERTPLAKHVACAVYVLVAERA